MNEKKMFATRIDPDILKKVKHLSIDLEVSISALTEEALRDLLEKYSGEQTPDPEKNE
jgi:predicted transcriptional regulator